MTSQTTDARLTGFLPVVEIMNRIGATGAEWPHLHLSFGDKPLVLSRAGAKSRRPGAINLTDGGGYGSGSWYGCIDVDGTFIPGKGAHVMERGDKLNLWNVLSRMRNGEAEAVMAEHGRRFGRCSVCNRELSNEESVELGIGPVCRGKVFG